MAGRSESVPFRMSMGLFAQSRAATRPWSDSGPYRGPGLRSNPALESLLEFRKRVPGDIGHVRVLVLRCRPQVLNQRPRLVIEVVDRAHCPQPHPFALMPERRGEDGQALIGVTTAHK